MPGMVEVFRARIRELGITYETVDELAGLPQNYTSKIMCSMKMPGKIALEALCGALAAFLIFNRYPARVFMGDTGALAIGFALAAMAIQQGWILLLPIVGLVFVLETLSVIIQVAYFKATGGRRIFTMTPIHYTFHHEGWSENRIALTFWGAGAVSALIAIALVRMLA